MLRRPPQGIIALRRALFFGSTQGIADGARAAMDDARAAMDGAWSAVAGVRSAMNNSAGGSE